MSIDITTVPNIDKVKKRLYDRLVESEGCLEYSGSLDIGGYGKIGLTVSKGEYKHLKTHRLSYMLTFGNIPDGLVVMHLCDNPKCCNPVHLTLGTHKDNMLDKVAKGRATGAHKGNKHHVAKLNDEQVVWAYESTLSQTEIAKELGVHPSRISMIKSGKAWSHLTKQTP